MKIAIATGIFPPEIGGPATYLQKLLPLLKKEKWRFKIVTYGDPRPDIITVSRSHNSLVRLLLFTWELFKVARKCDVIFALDNFSAGLPALIISKITKKPLVSRIAGIFAYEEETKRSKQQRTMSEFLNGEKKGLIWMLYGLQEDILTNSKKVIATTDFFEKVCRSQGVTKPALVQINTAPVITKIKKTKAELRRQLGFSKKNNYLVSASRLIPHKSVEGIVRTLKLLPQSYHLIIIGEGTQETSIRKSVNNLKLDKRVKFIGRLSLEDTQKYLKAADGYVLNSRYESLSNTALEAIALGTPVFLSRVEGNTDLVKESGTTGFLFTFDNAKEMAATIRNLENKKLIKEICELAKNSINTWENVFEQTKKVLKEACE